MHFPQKLCQNPLIPREHFDFDKTAFLSRKTNLSTISASSAEYSLSAHKERNWLQRGTSLIVEAGFLARGWGSLAGPPPPPPELHTMSLWQLGGSTELHRPAMPCPSHPHAGEASEMLLAAAAPQCKLPLGWDAAAAGG